MTAQPNAQSDSNMSDIVRHAEEAKQHLIQALRGLDEVIALASKQGRQDIVDKAREGRRAVVSAVTDFNDHVADRDDIDPDDVQAADSAATDAFRVIRQSIAALERRMDSVESALGIEFDENGSPTFKDNGLVATVNKHHQVLNGDDDQPGLVSQVQNLNSQVYGTDAQPGLIHDVKAIREALPRDEHGNFILDERIRTVAQSVTSSNSSSTDLKKPALIGLVIAVIAFPLLWGLTPLGWVASAFLSLAIGAFGFLMALGFSSGSSSSTETTQSTSTHHRSRGVREERN